LEKLSKGQISVDEAERRLHIFAVEQVGDFARLDVNRDFRKGVPEIILGEGKTCEDVTAIVLKMLDEKGRAIISRLDKRQIEYLAKSIPEHTVCKVNDKIGIFVIRRSDIEVKRTGGKIGLLTAGTSDIPVAEESKVVAEEMGCEVVCAYDVGVAGIHRLFPPLREMMQKDVDAIVVVAGREGALPAVVAGLVDVPVIAVPTSIGYGLGEKGLSALTAMLQACSLGLAVVNIDGGVAAGVVAALIANRVARTRD
jgi:hypothetical protein